ncbi:hypothetical protein Tco_0099577 [Tanacetum coccineum]
MYLTGWSSCWIRRMVEVGYAVLGIGIARFLGADTPYLFSGYGVLPVENSRPEFKKLKRSRIPIVKVRWNSKQGPEFTWERKDQMKLKYPHLFSSSTS